MAVQLHPTVRFPSSAGQPLPPGILQKMEDLFNTSFADVRVHIGAQPELLGAFAFTHGSHIYFAPGQYDTASCRGQQLIAHELTHVIQQRTNRVQNPFGSGIAVISHKGLEAEADCMGARAAIRFKPSTEEPRLSASAHHPCPISPRSQFPRLTNNNAPVIQRLVIAMGKDQKNAVEAFAKTQNEQFAWWESIQDLQTNKDQRLTLWGHSGQDTFGDNNFSPSALAQWLLRRNLDLSSHTTLEIIGCEPNKTDTIGLRTYAQDLQIILNTRLSNKKSQKMITVLTEPMPKPEQSSTHFRLEAIGQFVYIYGNPSEVEAASGQLNSLGRIHNYKRTQEGELKVYNKLKEYLDSRKKAGKEIFYNADSFSKIRYYLVPPPSTTQYYKDGKEGSKSELLIPNIYYK
ncbi:MAG TPA: DUF4157 domain-containing protein [Thermoanaerobaculia bacterium]|jgi:hypothetical protein|nr:DUF4157 domain-containing protein [Thermoanaerobaculia bacterium]